MLNTFLENDVAVCQRVRLQIIDGKLPEGYMTSEEFWGKVTTNLIKRLRYNGYIQ
ncbi:MAG: hypothetical protein LBN23_03195 [Paludibacter sp.]|jgi:hypothetical protein|nr:hypothetical protein [Paludibacter sp.]